LHPSSRPPPRQQTERPVSLAIWRSYPNVQVRSGKDSFLASPHPPLASHSCKESRSPMLPAHDPPPALPATPPPAPPPPPPPPPPPRPPAPRPRRFPALRLHDLVAAGQARVPWLWDGYLAPGNVPLLTSQWKSGKTTLMSVLLSRLRDGGTLAGLTLRPGRAAVVTEESSAQWYLRSLKVPFGEHLTWFCQPFEGKPRPEEWLALLDQLVQLQAESGLDLLVLDPLASLLPHENDAGSVLETLLPLQRLTGRGAAVLALHHPRKGTSWPARRPGAAAPCPATWTF